MKANLKKKAESGPRTEIVAMAIEALLDVKGKEIVLIDLTDLNDAIADFFIICEGTSNTHIKALAENVIFEIKKSIGELPISREGAGNAEWILVDYFDFVVHVFDKDKRAFYQLEELWNDGKSYQIEENGSRIALD